MTGTQKETVFTAVIAIVKPVDNRVNMKGEQKKEAHKTIAAALHVDRAILLSKESSEKYPTADDLAKKYVPGLLNNWLRKDTRLNGGTIYKIKNPGSRAGAGDEKIKEMNKLMTQFQIDPEKFADKIPILQKAIDVRKAEIAKEKAKTVKIDLSVLPEELLNELDLNSEEGETNEEGEDEGTLEIPEEDFADQEVA
jgi:hypothetical protein